ncbi:hypothetical protein Pan181_47260 [Aeoliella mucimassa]|uniref:Uncharacterized protein n=1 Tax=Aeoliella mucimassa TaxID=2527972 RepID=A0A518AUT4_9BACT|nr:hypothetical protein Pan181_47260 [Aeoliella mucimassa]
MNHYSSRITASVLTVVCCLGCGTDSPSSTPKVEDRVAEPWISKPKAEWPQIVLTNHAEFNGHSSLQGASTSFLKSIPLLYAAE